MIYKCCPRARRTEAEHAKVSDEICLKRDGVTRDRFSKGKARVSFLLHTTRARGRPSENCNGSTDVVDGREKYTQSRAKCVGLGRDFFVNVKYANFSQANIDSDRQQSFDKFLAHFTDQSSSRQLPTRYFLPPALTSRHASHALRAGNLRLTGWPAWLPVFLLSYC